MSLEFEDVVRIGDRAEMVLITKSVNKNSEEEKIYVTKVHEINDDGDIEVLMPMEKTKLVLLPVDSQYEITFYCQKGMYGCDMRVKERYKQDSLFVLVLEQLTELTKQQRREFFRYDCVVGMNTRGLTEEDTLAFAQNEQFILLPEPEDKSVILDISGGGFRFISAAHYEIGQLVHCKFMLPVKGEMLKFEVMMRCLGKKPVKNNPANTEFRGNFHYITSADRENIIKYIFEGQRKSRQKN